MKKFVLLSTVAAFSLASGVAGAVTLKNTDKTVASVSVDMGGKAETVKIKAGDSFDTKGKDASFTLGKTKAVSAKGEDKLEIKGGKIEAVKDQTAKAESGKTATN